MSLGIKGFNQGQAVVEVLLILPIFLMLVFSIMEIGHLAFRTILIHHAAYEVARIGSLTTKPWNASPGCAVPTLDVNRMQNAGQRMLRKAQVIPSGPKPTLVDPQDGCMNYDVEVTVQELVPLVFVPLTGFFLGRLCDGGKSVQYRCIAGTVRMPIERPLFK